VTSIEDGVGDGLGVPPPVPELLGLLLLVELPQAAVNNAASRATKMANERSTRNDPRKGTTSMS